MSENVPKRFRVNQPQGLVSIHLAVFLFGLSGLLGKMISAAPCVIVFSRAALAGLVLGAVLWIGKTRVRWDWRQLLFLAGSGTVLAVHWVTFFQAIQVSTVAIGLLSFSSFPLFVTFLEPFVFHERLQGRDVVSALLVMVGLALVAPNFDFRHHLTQGVLWGVLSGLTFALLSVMNRKFVQGLSPVAIGAGQNAVAALALLPFIGATQWPTSSRDLVLLAVLGVFCTAWAHVLFIRGLASVRAQIASVLTGLEPVYGIAFAWLLLREAPSARTLCGGAIILGATLLATRQRSGNPERSSVNLIRSS